MGKYGLVILVALLASGVSGIARADQPAHGNFEWKQLFGTYRFDSCENNGSHLWEVSPRTTHLVLSDDPFDTGIPRENSLVMALFNEPPSLIVPIWSMENINLGPAKTFDDQTGVVQTVSESYATANGLFASSQWNFGDDSGTATLDLEVDPQGRTSYTMTRTSSYTNGTIVEHCRLRRVQ